MTAAERQGYLDGYLYKTAYDLPFDVGDTILAGHFKNQRRVVKGFGTGKHNQPVVITDKGAVSLFPFRVQKLMSAGVLEEQKAAAVEQDPENPNRYVARDGDKEQGYVLLMEALKNPDKFVALREFYVNPEARGQGIARQLIEHVRAQVPNKSIVLKAHPYKDKPKSRKDLVEMYKHLGAEPYPYRTNRLWFRAADGSMDGASE
jgi:GNAT superfamily N-acetyltransferase